MKKRIFLMLAVLAIFVTCVSPVHAQLGLLGVGKPPSGTNNLAYAQTCETINSTSANPSTINIGASGACANGGTAANPHAGNLVWVWVGYNSDVLAITSHTDTLGNTWTCGYDTTTAQAYCYSILTTGGSADTFSLGTTGTQTSAMGSLEIGGPNATPLDGSAQYGSAGPGTSLTLPAITPGNANDVIISCAVNRTANVTYAAGPGYSIPFGQYAGGAFPSGACEAQIVTTTSTYTPTITVGTSSTVRAITAAFKSS